MSRGTADQAPISRGGARTGLAAGWYIAMRSPELRGRPRQLDLFGRSLVAWRGGDGRAVIMPRYCPHLNADLALGKLVGGSLRCPFHHWRFDSSGTCVDAPGLLRTPKRADVYSYPVIERYGFVWAWYGGAEPMFPLPGMPALEEERRHYLAYPFAHATPAPARRILENAFDFYHFMTLHGVSAAEPLSLATLADPENAAENGSPIMREAWFGALLEARGMHLPRTLTVLGVRGEQLSLLVDGWPGGQRLTFSLDGQVVAKELLGISPVNDGKTIFQGWAMVRRTGNPLRTALTYLMYRGQHLIGTMQDLRIYQNAVDGNTIPAKYDHGVLRYRKYYASWVDRARPAEQGAARG